MRLILLLLTFGCFVISSVYSQVNENNSSRILFQGIVIDAGSFTPLNNSQISINRSFSSISENNGAFSFYVNKRDTVVFNSLGYKPTTFFISDTLTGKEFNVGIYMKSDTLSIGEVIIVPRYSNIKSEILNSKSKVPSIMDNAKYNIAVSAYAGRNSVSSLGDPDSNYELLRQRQKVDAFEKGGIPSDKILGLSPLMLIPAAYLLMHGLPEKPAPMAPKLTDYEIDQIQKKYLETIQKK